MCEKFKEIDIYHTFFFFDIFFAPQGPPNSQTTNSGEGMERFTAAKLASLASFIMTSHRQKSRPLSAARSLPLK